jgi:hypothetical protein
MNKILPALGILGAGGGAFLTVRQAVLRLGQETQVSHAAWQMQTQLLAVTQAEQVRLKDRVRELRQALDRNPAPEQNELWSALEANNVGHLQADLREHLLEELGLDWRSAPDFIVVPKEALREFELKPIQENRLADPVAAAFAVTQSERERVEAAIAQAGLDFNDWTVAQTERTEPTNDVVAQYTVAGNETLGLSISNALDAELVGALGQQRAELIRPAVNKWAYETGFYLQESRTLIIRRCLVGDESRLLWQEGRAEWVRGLGAKDFRELAPCPFPARFLPVFSNGWADLAEREGFALPKEFQEKQPQASVQ